MVIESFLLSGVRGNSILSELNHFFYSFFAFGLTSIVTLQKVFWFFGKPLAFLPDVCYNTGVAQGYSSAGRVPVSKTVGRGFESSCPCQVYRSKKIRKRKQEKTGDFERFLPFFRPWIFSEFHRSLLPFSMLCPDSDSRKGLNLIVISLLRAFLARRYPFPS